MPYYDVGTTIKPSKKSLLRRPATSYETPSPGPQYDLGPTIVPTRRSIGVRTSLRDGGGDNPAPGSYWIAEETPIVGFIGPDDRGPVNLAHEAQQPGPGYYEHRDLFAPNGRGCPFTSKGITDERPDTAAPYQPSRSTLGGPMYTIGLKNV
jgi:hypothetical protein